MIERHGIRRSAGAVILAALAALVLAAPVAACSVEVTHGRIHEFAVGADRGLHIRGQAVMIRTSAFGGRTEVFVHVRGLQPNTAYGAHVHKQACAAVDAAGNPTYADGHYQFDPAGGANAVNEIWPEFTTNGAGVGNGFARNDGIAGPTAVSVVIHAPKDPVTGVAAKIACADLA